MSKVQLLNYNDVQKYKFPLSEEGRYAKEFLLAFMSCSGGKYINNIFTKMYCIKVDNFFLPITVNETQYTNSYVTSPYGVITYSQDELKRLNHPVITPVLLPVIKIIGHLLKKGKINRVVTVNNWLLSTNLYNNLSESQISKVVLFLQNIYPTYCLMWRSLNNDYPKNLLNSFKNLPCRLVCSRQIYIYEPQNYNSLNKKQRWNIRNDNNLIYKHGYKIITHDNLQYKDLDRIKQLYEYLYIDKYTNQNPQFTEKFFKLALDKKLLNIFALSKDGVINGVIGYFVRNNVMTTPLVGYDTHLSEKIGLYRMLTSICINEATNKKLILNHSSGAAHFKRVRGMYSTMEYAAIFDSHLSKSRKLVWICLDKVLNNIAKPILLKYKL